MNKPHQLAKQNEMIKQLIDKERNAAAASGLFAQTFSQRSGSSFGVGPKQPSTAKVEADHSLSS